MCESVLLAHEEELNRRPTRLCSNKETHTSGFPKCLSAWLTHPNITPQECRVISSSGRELPAVCVFCICCVGQLSAPRDDELSLLPLHLCMISAHVTPLLHSSFRRLDVYVSLDVIFLFLSSQKLHTQQHSECHSTKAERGDGVSND